MPCHRAGCKNSRVFERDGTRRIAERKDFSLLVCKKCTQRLPAKRTHGHAGFTSQADNSRQCRLQRNSWFPCILQPRRNRRRVRFSLRFRKSTAWHGVGCQSGVHSQSASSGVRSAGTSVGDATLPDQARLPAEFDQPVELVRKDSSLLKPMNAVLGFSDLLSAEIRAPKRRDICSGRA